MNDTNLNTTSRPDFPHRQGIAAADTARLIICALLCMFQYWLLTATLEAYHAGNHKIVIGAFFASLACFLMAGGLVVTGELAQLKQQKFLKSLKEPDPSSTGANEEHHHD